MDGCSITGGYIYRGSEISELYGRYIFGDYCTGKVWSFRLKDDKITDFVDHTSDLLNSINKNGTIKTLTLVMKADLLAVVWISPKF